MGNKLKGGIMFQFNEKKIIFSELLIDISKDYLFRKFVAMILQYAFFMNMGKFNWPSIVISKISASTYAYNYA